MPESRSITGLRAHLAGGAAEEQAERAYLARGAKVLERRWRGEGGEVDLIVREGDVVVFVEVKSGRSRDAALARITPAQMRRVQASAGLYLDREPAGALAGALSEARIDVVLVFGTGEVEILENAFGQG
ncbi:hypothetical protein PH5382_02745 [Phaeobacter sp. CECT 5382]|uniref:YraN family protein n=1 Tax=Phaeobacter sp. CECT 5382 TaxID=1712645 RepID=UPI0006DBD748|nr:YraN family protein [Phaeobacter sp. CECT 5382]CUH88802.1 hypothetical protein PH5382_02745 [Phaeobacter sp. CECT 5382]